MSTQFHLAIPRVQTTAQIASEAMPAAQKLLGRASSQALPDTTVRGLAAHLFDVGYNDSGQMAALPVAALSRLADTGHWDAGWWLRLEPVHFRADRDDLMLFGPETLSLSPEEGAALATTVREHLFEEGLHLQITESQRWYLAFEKAPACQFIDLPNVAGRMISDYMPFGVDAIRFKRLLNQMQMLLHNHPVNQAREQRGQLTANGVWCWGGGAFGELNPKQWSGVWSDTALFRGLALLAGNEPEAVPDNFNAWFATNPQGQHLVVLPIIDLSVLETEWFEPLLLALRNKLLDKVVIHLSATERVFSLTPHNLWRFWRRPVPLHTVLEGIEAADTATDSS